MPGRVEGKVAIVTGAGTGIGRACAVILAREGARVVVANRNADNGNDTVRRIQEAGGEARFVQTDVSRGEDCRNVVAETVSAFGRVDVLVNNAGIFPRASLDRTDEEFWTSIMDTDLKGPYLLCREAIPHMVKQGGGSVINMGSVHGLGGAPELFAYATAKGALLTMTKNLARAYSRQLVRVNYVIPGWVATEGELVIRGQDKAWQEEANKRAPMGRLQVPEDAAYVVLFLASDESEQVTAAVINADGGASMF